MPEGIGIGSTTGSFEGCWPWKTAAALSTRTGVARRLPTRATGSNGANRGSVAAGDGVCIVLILCPPVVKMRAVSVLCSTETEVH